MFEGTEGQRPISVTSSATHEDMVDDPGQYTGAQVWWSNSDYFNMAREFVNPSTNVIFVDFLKKYPPTKKATVKLRNFYQLTIHPLLVSGNIPSERDEQVLIGIFNISMAELPLGLTTFDTNPAFHQIINLTRLHFINQLQKARKGGVFKQLTSNRQDVYQYEGNVEPARRGIIQSLAMLGGR